MQRILRKEAITILNRKTHNLNEHPTESNITEISATLALLLEQAGYKS
jgi:hypothetical protein